MLGPDQPIILHLLDIEPAKQSLEGVKMELIDSAFPLLQGKPGGCLLQFSFSADSSAARRGPSRFISSATQNCRASWACVP